MRIAIIYLGRRGSGGPLSLGMAEGLSKSAEILAVVSKYSESLTVWDELNIPIIVTKTYRGIFEALLEWIYPRTTRVMCQKIREWKPDVVLFPMFYTWNPLIQHQLKGIPSIVAVHDPIPHPDAASIMYGWLERWSMRMASRIIIFSQVFLNELAKRGFDVSKVDIIPHGNLAYYQRFQSDLQIGRSKTSPTTLLFFGRITAYKGLEVLLQTYRELQSRRSIALIIAGSGDLSPYQKYLEGLTQVEIHNQWLYEYEIPALFQRAGIVVLPYTSGSQSGVVALAASFGLPVIATSTGGIAEQIEDQETGLLVEPSSIQELGAAIEKLLDDPDAARQMGGKLQRKYAEEYNWEKIGKMILAACQKAAA